MRKKNITLLFNCKAQSFTMRVTLSIRSPPEQGSKPLLVVDGCLCIYFWHIQST